MVYEIGIFSGKGGVGKTSITASLVTLLHKKGKRVLAADCDVDAPNLSIIFRDTTKKEEEFNVKTTEKATLIKDKCTSCRLCIDKHFCEFSALTWDEEASLPKIDEILCEGCSACYWLCPEKAFSINPIESGTIIRYTSYYGFPLTTGETILGAQTSGKLVTELKNYSKKFAEKEHYEIMVIDGPPGIGCPVIAAASDLTYGIIVIEPTSTALHDASRLIEVFEPFGFEYGIVINKSTLWPEGIKEIEKFAEERNIEILAKIPLDPEWPNSIARAKPVIEVTQNKEVISQLEKLADVVISKIEKQKA